MRGGLIWYVAGIVSTLIVINDWFAQFFRVVVGLLTGAVEFMSALGAFGFVGTLVLVGISLFVGGRWSERARGAHEAEQAWNRRSAHR